MKSFAVILSALMLLCGCSTTLVRDEPSPVRLGAVSVETPQLVEALLARKGTSVHAIDGAWKDQTFQAQCVTKGDGEKLTVIFLAPQMRLVTITITKPHAIKYERVPQIPSAFEPEYVLADLAFVKLETSELRRVLGGEINVSDDGTVRRITTKGGDVIAEVTRNADGTTLYKNILYGYQYALKPFSNGQ